MLPLLLSSVIYFGSIFCPGSTDIPEFKYHGNMGYRSWGIHLNQLLGSVLPTGEVPHTCKIVYYL